LHESSQIGCRLHELRAPSSRIQGTNPGRRARGGLEGALPRRQIMGAGQVVALPRHRPPLRSSGTIGRVPRGWPRGGRRRSLRCAGCGAPPQCPCSGDLLLLLHLRWIDPYPPPLEVPPLPDLGRVLRVAGTEAVAEEAAAGVRVREHLRRPARRLE
jgi:hypothetical protein